MGNLTKKMRRSWLRLLGVALLLGMLAPGASMGQVVIDGFDFGPNIILGGNVFAYQDLIGLGGVGSGVGVFSQGPPAGPPGLFNSVTLTLSPPPLPIPNLGLYVGVNGGTGTYNLTDGLVIANFTGVGFLGGGSGTFNQSGGSCGFDYAGFGLYVLRHRPLQFNRRHPGPRLHHRRGYGHRLFLPERRHP